MKEKSYLRREESIKIARILLGHGRTINHDGLDGLERVINNDVGCTITENKDDDNPYNFQLYNMRSGMISKVELVDDIWRSKQVNYIPFLANFSSVPKEAFIEKLAEYAIRNKKISGDISSLSNYCEEKLYPEQDRSLVISELGAYWMQQHETLDVKGIVYRTDSIHTYHIHPKTVRKKNSIERNYHGRLIKAINNKTNKIYTIGYISGLNKVFLYLPRAFIRHEREKIKRKEREKLKH